MEKVYELEKFLFKFPEKLTDELSSQHSSFLTTPLIWSSVVLTSMGLFALSPSAWRNLPIAISHDLFELRNAPDRILKCGVK
jgi:hypothetical protein